MKTKKTSKKVLNIRKDFDDIFISLLDIEIEKSVRKYIDAFEDETSIQKYHKKFMEKAKNEETKYNDYSKFKALVNSLKNIEKVSEPVSEKKSEPVSEKKSEPVQEKASETVQEKAPVIKPKIIQEVKPVLEIEDDDFFTLPNRSNASKIFDELEA